MSSVMLICDYRAKDVIIQIIYKNLSSFLHYRRDASHKSGD